MINYYDKKGELLGLKEWTRLFEDFGYRRINQYERYFISVSTIWLGLDHNFFDGKPLIFETMVWICGEQVDEERYYTEEEAIQGHRKFVIKYRWRIDLIVKNLLIYLINKRRNHEEN